jgi:hypothetical protein
MTYVAAFRTYSWDDGVAELARRFFSACPGARQVVLADETKGPIGISGYDVISHTEDTSNLGLLVYPRGNSLWHNVDYGLYILRTALPGYDYYLTSESDLAVNTDLDAIVAAASARQLDLIAHLIRPATPDWLWYEAAATIFKEPLGSVLFFMVVSAHAVDLLFHMRRQLTLQYQEGTTPWLFCEAFVPSILKLAGMSTAEASEFADTENLRVRPRLLITDARANQPNSLAHSVLGQSAYLRAITKEFPPADWFSEESELQQALAALPLREYAAQLCGAFIRAEDMDGLARFKAHLAGQGIAMPKNSTARFVLT